MSKISIQNLRKEFGSKTILDGVDLSVQEGETICIIGSSGSGKSTLLRCINFLDSPTTCDYKFKGRSIDLVRSRRLGGLKPKLRRDKRLLQKRLGMIFQDFGLWPHMTVMENLVKPQMLALGRKRADAVKRAQEHLNDVGLLDYIDRHPENLSGGQKQRVAIARTLCLDKEVILMDEPTSALDPSGTAGVQEIIQKLAQEKRTMIVVTHDMAFARKVADRVIFIRNGAIEEQGTPEKIFGGSKNIHLRNFIQGEISLKRGAL